MHDDAQLSNLGFPLPTSLRRRIVSPTQVDSSHDGQSGQQMANTIPIYDKHDTTCGYIPPTYETQQQWPPFAPLQNDAFSFLWDDPHGTVWFPATLSTNVTNICHFPPHLDPISFIIRTMQRTKDVRDSMGGNKKWGDLLRYHDINENISNPRRLYGWSLRGTHMVVRGRWQARLDIRPMPAPLAERLV